MKKKYKKPELRKLGSMDLQNGVGLNQSKPIEFNFSKMIEPEIIYDPSKLPESVSIEGPKCPKCGTRTQEMVMYGVMGGNSLSKNHCRKCGHVWGPRE